MPTEAPEVRRSERIRKKNDLKNDVFTFKESQNDECNPPPAKKKKVAAKKKLLPFRVTSTFTNQLPKATALDDSILSRQISPIPKVMEVYKSNSPAVSQRRETFSQVKSMVQSTPHPIRKILRDNTNIKENSDDSSGPKSSLKSKTKENVIPSPKKLKVKKKVLQSKAVKREILKSSNVETLAQVPEETLLLPQQEIFSEIAKPSTSKTSKPSKKSQKKDDIDNCFGFDTASLGHGSVAAKDDSTYILQGPDTHVPNSLNKLKDSAKTKSEKMLVESIKEVLMPESSGLRKEPAQRNKENPVQDVASTSEFANTFDVSDEETKEEPVEKEPGLFEDLEQSHFTEPARHSYNRKRKMSSSFSDDEKEKDVEAKIVKSSKVKKAGKKKTPPQDNDEEKKNEELIQNTLKEFELIDKYDLIVE